MKKERTSILLKQEDLVNLRALSRKTNKSTSFLIQEAVSEFLAKNIKVKEIGIAGMVDSGDPYFAEKDEEILDKIIAGED
jgi:predicted DNA-binding protein